jgi:hypothetical protein
MDFQDCSEVVADESGFSTSSFFASTRVASISAVVMD